MNSLPKKLVDKINHRRQENSFRKLPDTDCGVDFASNDYLGFSRAGILEPAIDKIVLETNYKTGATGSRLLTGNHTLYKIAENEIADFHKMESALIFNSGYDANLGFFSCVPQKGDLILFDSFIHASIRDGIKMSNAKAWKFKHNNLADLTSKIKRAIQKFDSIYIVTESVFSMDGDNPPLQEIAACCEKYNCLMVVDEAHALGVMGNRGAGMLSELDLQNKVFASVVTFGKALGAHGAAVLGSNNLKDYLVNFARSLIYTTALPPHSVAGIIAGYQLLKENNKAFESLCERVVYFKEAVKKHKLETFFIKSNSAIHCAVIPGVNDVKKVSYLLSARGYDVKAILAPTVAKGGERLRFCLHSYNSEHEIASVLKLLATFVNDNLRTNE